jgi:hypothetical protein
MMVALQAVKAASGVAAASSSVRKPGHSSISSTGTDVYSWQQPLLFNYFVVKEQILTHHLEEISFLQE